MDQLISPNRHKRIRQDCNGFTLIELVITMAVTAVLGIAMVTNYMSQQRSAGVVRQITQMQQQLRGSFYIMERDIRITGYGIGPEVNPGGVRNVQRWTITNNVTAPAVNAAGSPSLTITGDFNLDGNFLNDRTATYRLFDDNDDGITDLVLDNDDGTRDLIAEGIEAIGFAFAIDAVDAGLTPNPDGNLDRTAAGNIIWAVDSNNDNVLDTNLDTNDDGVIDLADDSDGDNRITAADGAAGALATPVPLNRIRAVRVWLLARARRNDTQYSDTTTRFVVGDTISGPYAGNASQFRRYLLERTYECRNTGI